jgi:hypothetical protein
MSRAQGNKMANAPRELVDIGLMERFGWTPAEIDAVPLGRLQRLFVAMEQREQSQIAAREVEAQRQKQRKR